METHKTYCRRDYRRFILDAQATLLINKTKEEPSILTDLCPRGSGIVTNYPIEQEERLAVLFKIPYLFRDTVYKEAKVVWCKRLAENLWKAGLDFGQNNRLSLSQ